MRYLLALLATTSLTATTTAAAPPSRVNQATFDAPCTHPMDPYYAPHNTVHYGPKQFRWGWFGADYYPPAPIVHRDYKRGWLEWHYRR